MAESAKNEAIPPPAYELNLIGTRERGFPKTYMFRALIAGTILCIVSQAFDIDSDGANLLAKKTLCYQF
jgi:hypothetical protein